MRWNTKRLRKARQRMYDSQQDFADAIKIARPTVSNWERGAHEPDPPTMKLVALMLGVTEEWLAGEGPDQMPDIPIPGGTFDPPESKPAVTRMEPIKLAIGDCDITLMLDGRDMGFGEYAVTGRLLMRPRI